MTIFRYWLSTFIALFLYSSNLTANQAQLVSTESDPDAFVQNCVNVINGDYCESAADLVITGPDALILQRFYSTRDSVTGTHLGSWRMLPERFLVVGKDPSANSSKVLAFTGDRSGGIFPYSGIRNSTGNIQDPLKVDIFSRAIGMVNTYAKEINGQNNHTNNRLYYKNDTCELILGDGTKRIYKKILRFPSLIFGEELVPLMAEQVEKPEYFLLVQEILPSGNKLFFSYDPSGHIISIEMKNNIEQKVLSWIRFIYNFQKNHCDIHLETSDVKTLSYNFQLENGLYQLKKINGSHLIPISYEYNGVLVKKILPEGRFTEIEYQNRKVKALKGPHPISGHPIVTSSFFYGKDYTDVWNVLKIKTRYAYDKRLQLTAIEHFDEQNALVRIEKRFWGETESNAGQLLAKTIGDEKHTYSYRSFLYDGYGNVVEEKLYGNLTGASEVSLQVSSDGKLINNEPLECLTKNFSYSTDGFNLLSTLGNIQGDRTQYIYKAGTNLLVNKFIYEQNEIRKRTFQFYNEDAVCIKIINDDGSNEEEKEIYGWGTRERTIKNVKPKMSLPGIGLPEVIEEKVLDFVSRNEILIKKFVNVYDSQSNLLSCSSYDANDQYAFMEERTYNHLGRITSETDAKGRNTEYSYDEIGNQVSIHTPAESKVILTSFDYHNQPVEVIETNNEDRFATYNLYDLAGRKISSIDRFGNSTGYEYDAFNRLTKVIYPNVLNENNQNIHPTFIYNYDLFGNVISIQDPKGYITLKSYNLQGEPTKISYPDGSYELLKYNLNGSIHRSFSRDKIITDYEYDYLGRYVNEKRSLWNERNTPLPISSKTYKYNGFRCIYEKEDDLVKRYIYDSAGRLSSLVQHKDGKTEKDPESRITNIIYDAFGRIHQRKVYYDEGPKDFSLENFEYDFSSNIVEKRIEDSEGNILLQKMFSYNSKKQCIEEYGFENGIKVVYFRTVYDCYGEPICYQDGLEQDTKIIIDRFYQNALSQKVVKKTIINPIGIQTEIEFDALSRISSISKKNLMGIIISSQKNLYDALGNLSLEIHDQIVDGKLIGTQKICFNYGPMGRLEKNVQAVDSPLEKQIDYNYNSLGQLIYKIDQGGTTEFDYGLDGQLRKIEVKNSKKELQVLNSYQYDQKGNITNAYSINGIFIGRSYNVFGEVTRELFRDEEGSSYSLQYTYDKKGRTKEIILPDQSKILYQYNALFGKAVKRISAKNEILYTHTYDHYDHQGRLQEETLIGNHGSQEYAYNLSGQKISSKGKFLNEQYNRDSLGRLLEVDSKTQENYEYNDLSQLKSDKKNIKYNYDSLDNCLNIGNDRLLYNALNQLTQKSNTQFSYDPQGNLSRKILDCNETKFECNGLSELVSIQKNDQTSHLFSYDPFGRLLVEKHFDTKEKNKKNISTSRYFYLGHQEIGSLTADGKINSLKILGLNGDELSLNSIAFELQDQIYLPIHDTSKNVSQLIDFKSGQQAESYHYTAFGEESIYNASGESISTSLIGNPWRFAEKRFNEKTGLSYFGLRFYDPAIGRWISKDPAGFADGLNLYAYLHNDPLNHLDRFGLSTESLSQDKFNNYFYGTTHSTCVCGKLCHCHYSNMGINLGTTTSSYLPTISYHARFEEIFSEYQPSKNYDLSDLGLPELPDDLRIGFINGIWNNYSGSRASAQYISRLAGGYNVHAVYNATHGTSVDLLECVLGLNYVATDPVHQLHKMWDNYFDKSANGKFLMICHSQGALHVRNALLDYPPELRERIIVVAIAPASFMYEETCARVVHYRADSTRDFVPRLDRKGNQRSKNVIVDLPSHPDAPYFDHEFASPTYKKRLSDEINQYLENL